MKYKSLLLIVFLLIVSLLAACGDGDKEEKEPKERAYKIGILQFIDQLEGIETGFKEGMTERGYTNVTYVRRNANANMEEISGFAQELVDEEVDLIIAITTPSAMVAQAVTEGTDIPIVFIGVSNPLAVGLVESIQQPGGNMTGITDGEIFYAGKRLEMLRVLNPAAETVLSVYSYEESLLEAEDNLRAAADSLGIELIEIQVHTTQEAIEAFESIQPGEVDAVFMPSDSIVTNAQEALFALATRDHIPFIYPTQVPGVFASYGLDMNTYGAQASSLTEQILGGANAGELPVEFPENLFLVIDLQVAEQIGYTVPEEALNQANTLLR